MSRILLADDSPHAQRMGERILREEGFEVVSLTDGNAAMLRLADVDPDVIIADVFLPGKSGFELCRHVKSDPRLKHVRVVLTAGLLEPFDEDEAKRAGCDAILKKPFEASKVVVTIDPLVKESQLARSQAAEEIALAPPPLTTAQPAEPEPPKPDDAPKLAEVSRLFEESKTAEVPKAAEPPSSADAPKLAEAPKPAEPPRPIDVSKPAEPPPPPPAPEIDPERVRAAVTLALDASLPAIIQEITERVLIALGH